MADDNRESWISVADLGLAEGALAPGAASRDFAVVSTYADFRTLVLIRDAHGDAYVSRISANDREDPMLASLNNGGFNRVTLREFLGGDVETIPLRWQLVNGVDARTNSPWPTQSSSRTRFDVQPGANATQYWAQSTNGSTEPFDATRWALFMRGPNDRAFSGDRDEANTMTVSSGLAAAPPENAKENRMLAVFNRQGELLMAPETEETIADLDVLEVQVMDPGVIEYLIDMMDRSDDKKRDAEALVITAFNSLGIELLDKDVVNNLIPVADLQLPDGVEIPRQPQNARTYFPLVNVFDTSEPRGLTVVIRLDGEPCLLQYDARDTNGPTHRALQDAGFEARTVRTVPSDMRELSEILIPLVEQWLSEHDRPVEWPDTLPLPDLWPDSPPLRESFGAARDRSGRPAARVPGVDWGAPAVDVAIRSQMQRAWTRNINGGTLDTPLPLIGDEDGRWAVAVPGPLDEGESFDPDADDVRVLAPGLCAAIGIPNFEHTLLAAYDEEGRLLIAVRNSDSEADLDSRGFSEVMEAEFDMYFGAIMDVDPTDRENPRVEALNAVEEHESLLSRRRRRGNEKGASR